MRPDGQENQMHLDDAIASTFVNILTCLLIIQNSDKFDAKIKYEANILLQNSLKFETILTEFAYLEICIWNGLIIKLSAVK